MNCVTAPKANWRCSPAISFYSDSTNFCNRSSIRYFYAGNRKSNRIRCNLKDTGSSSSSNSNSQPETSTGIQLYRDIERLLTETVKQSQDWGSSQDWDEIEGAWVLQPKTSKPKLVVHFIGGVFVGAAPQLSYRLFLERLKQKDVLVIATPFASGFDHFYIADEAQFKFDRCLRFLQERVQDLPVFGIGHSLGSVIHLLIGARYAVKRNGNVLMAFNNKDASLAMPLFSSVLVPVMQNFGPVLSQIASSPTVRLGAEMTMKQIENLSPSIVKQVFPLVEQLTPLYMDLINGKENFTPRPEETQRLIKSYYGITRNLLVKFKDDTIDETPTLAQVLSSGSAISSMLDMSIRTLPGDHALPLQQALPNVPPGMTEAVNRSNELLANLTAGTPWENVTKEVGNTLGKLLYDLEWNNGTVFRYTLDDDKKECSSALIDVGVLRPNWLDGATYLGQQFVDGFHCNVWQKVDFIWYYEDIVTKRPVHWVFYTGRSLHVMTFEVGAVLEDAKWQAPVYCFEEKQVNDHPASDNNIVDVGSNGILREFI